MDGETSMMQNAALLTSNVMSPTSAMQSVGMQLNDINQGV